MNVNNKLKLFGVIVMSVALAACAGKKVEEQVEDQSAAVDNSAQVDSYASEQVDSTALADAAAAANMATLYYFDFDMYQLTAATRADLDKVAKVLKNSGKKVRLEGHADERGTREYNLALGEKRAKAVVNYLTTQGVNKSQLEVISYGEEKPAALGSNEAAWAKNRRVELVNK